LEEATRPESLIRQIDEAFGNQPERPPLDAR
jgi:hypothetical protein